MEESERGIDAPLYPTDTIAYELGRCAQVKDHPVTAASAMHVQDPLKGKGEGDRLVDKRQQDTESQRLCEPFESDKAR